MRHLRNLDDWPVEDVAYAAASLTRRVRRKLARRRGVVVAGAAGLALCWVTIANGLWGQSEEHPAPMFSAAQDQTVVAVPARVEDLIATHSAVSASPLIVSVQERLIETGHFGGSADGVMGNETRDAIIAFERGAGLPETGEPTLALLTAQPGSPSTINDAPRVVGATVPTQLVPTRTVVPGRPTASKPDLAAVQKALNEAGFGPLDVDGLTGPKTQDAISRFAVSRGLPAGEGLSPRLLAALGVPG